MMLIKLKGLNYIFSRIPLSPFARLGFFIILCVCVVVVVVVFERTNKIIEEMKTEEQKTSLSFSSQIIFVLILLCFGLVVYRKVDEKTFTIVEVHDMRLFSE